MTVQFKNEDRENTSNEDIDDIREDRDRYVSINLDIHYDDVQYNDTYNNMFMVIGDDCCDGGMDVSEIYVGIKDAERAYYDLVKKNIDTVLLYTTKLNENNKVVQDKQIAVYVSGYAVDQCNSDSSYSHIIENVKDAVYHLSFFSFKD